VAETEMRYSDTVRPGEIIGTEPDPGRRVPVGGSVRMLVSNGPVPRTVPDLVGTPLHEALFTLGGAGLGIGSITRVDDENLPEGTVLSTSPAPGAQVPRNQPVSFTVVAPPPRATVPYLVGLGQTSAETLLAEAGLTIKVRLVNAELGSPRAGRVITQGLPPTTRVPPLTVVEIVVASPLAGATPAPGG
jgi:serine/threonine-protein kinase